MVIFERNDLRISLILPEVLRVEKGNWTELPTQIIQFREFGEIPHTKEIHGDWCVVQTDAARFEVDLTSGEIICITLPDGTSVTDPAKDILPGTARTLDQANGAVKLEQGIVSRSGISMLDDSKSLLLNEQGHICPRPVCSDRYCFAAGSDYQIGRAHV